MIYSHVTDQVALLGVGLLAVWARADEGLFSSMRCRVREKFIKVEVNPAAFSFASAIEVIAYENAS